MNIIAVYGTLKQWYGNHSLMSWCNLIWKDYVKCYGITGKWFPIGDFKDNWNSRFRLLVELYEVPTDVLPRVDALEWHPNWYKRIEVTTKSWRQVEIYNQYVKTIDTSILKEIDSKLNQYSWKQSFISW